MPTQATGVSAERVSKFTEIGASGLSVLGGRVNDEFLPVLRGERAIRTWREMGDNDPYSAAMLFGLLHTVLRVDWTVDLNEAPVKEGDFLEQCMDDMDHPFRDVVAEAMTCCQYGWSWLEVVLKMRNGPDAAVPSDFDDGRIGWRKMPLRAQETLWRWTIDPDEGAILGLQQRLYGSDIAQGKPTVVDIPSERSLLFRTTHHKNNPEGRSVLRSGFVPWNKRKAIEIFEGIGVERDFAGLPVFTVPGEMLAPDAPNDMKNAAEVWRTIGRNLRTDQQGYVLMPAEFDEATGNALYKFELASTQGRRLFDTTTIINRLAMSQLMSIMADVMMIGQNDVGSLALARTKAELFTAGIQAIVDEIRTVVNHYAVRRLFRVNGIPGPWPQFATSPVQRVDPGDFIAMLLQYSQSGAPLFPDNNLDNYIREEVLGIPQREADDGEGLEIAPKPKNQPAANKENEKQKQKVDDTGTVSTKPGADDSPDGS